MGMSASARHRMRRSRFCLCDAECMLCQMIPKSDMCLTVCWFSVSVLQITVEGGSISMNASTGISIGTSQAATVSIGNSGTVVTIDGTVREFW